MRVLFLSQRFLVPMDTGGKIRTGKLLEQLRDRVEITLVSNVEPARDGPHRAAVERLCSRFVEVPWRELARHTLRFYLRLLIRSLRATPITALNDHSSALERAVTRELETGRHDLVICDFVQSALNVRSAPGVPSLLFQHNVEAEIARRHRDRSRSPVARLFWHLQWQRMRRFEAEACRRFDTVVAVSERDAQVFQEDYGAAAVRSIPTGVDTDYYHPAPAREARPGEIVFCGSMDWLPNEDAMTSFLTDAWPSIRRARPDASLTIVGRHPSPALRRRVEATDGVVLTGWVDDTRPSLARAQVVVVPIRVGGGTRLKIYEAMAMARPVVSTTVGAEGLDYEAGRHLLLADGPQALAGTVTALLADPDRRRRIGEAARTHVETRFAWPRVADAFLRICQETVDRGPSPAAS